MEKKYFYNNLIILVALIICICFYNYKLDPYGIWKTDFSEQVLEPNKIYLKTKYILENPNKYDSFIFGSSRVGAIEGEFLENGNYYNMTYSQGLPKDWLENIKLFLSKGVKIKNIFIALDDFSFTVDPSYHDSEPLRLSYSKLNHHPFEYFKAYLLRDPWNLYNRETIKGQKINHRDGAKMDLYGTGRGFNTFTDEVKFLETITNEEINSSKYNIPTIYFDKDRTKDTLNEISKIINICHKNNISLKVIFNPLHHTTYSATDRDILNNAIEEVSKLTDLWDFTGLNSITSNNYYWLETSHYRLIVGRMILEKVYNINLGVDTPKDFGTYIEKLN